MDQDRLSVDEIFFAALEKSASGERSAYLDAACADDAELRQRVDRLLDARSKVVNFLESPAPGISTGATVEHSITEQPGEQIGPYKLLEQIGEGGFGVVFLAEQERPVRRKVALKIIKPGMDTRQVIARFEAERQALAMMDHPNIAKVFDAGTTGEKGDGNLLPERPEGSFAQKVPVPFLGRPYFVMELVQGIPITEYCDECSLTTRERLELFVSVCKAVQHAHQKGVIHRDIKPTNVLVAIQDGQATPKIIDFGVAKAINERLTERTLMTGFAQMVGTPVYMSPEQAELSPLGVDTRSDIYSLGVLLYELLTGTTPFEKDRVHAASYDELRRILREEEPPRPSARLSTLAADLATTVAARRRTDTGRLVQTVRGELDWIVMKCLEKDRNRRYETANSLARDVERYLVDEPVAACPPSPSYRFRKFARRNQVALLTIGIVSTALVTGTIVSTWQAIRATRAEQLAEQERGRAENNARLAQQAVNEFFSSVSENEELRNEPALQPLRRNLLQSALPYYEEFVRQDPAEPELRAEQADMCFRIAILTYETDSAENWLDWIERGIGILDKLVDGNYDVSALQSLQSGQRWIGGTLKHGIVSDYENAGRTLRRARRVWEKLVHRYPGVHGFRHDLAAFNYALGGVTESTDKEQALSLYAQASEIWQKLVDAHSDVPHYRAALVECLKTLALHRVRLRRTTQAEQAIYGAVKNAEILAAEFPETPGHRELMGMACSEFAYFLENTHRLDESEQAWRNALRVWGELQRDYPKTRRYLGRVLTAQIELGIVLWANDRKPEAAKQFNEVLALGEQLDTDQLHERFWFAWFLADCVDPQFRDPERATEIAENLVRKAPLVGEYWITLGIARYRGKEFQAAIQALNEAMTHEMYYADSAYARLFLAMAHHDNGESGLALDQYHQAVAQMETEYEWLWPRYNRAEAEQVLGIAKPINDQPATGAVPSTVDEIDKPESNDD
jgi:serine/threonine protein kinase/tetratricopeptide (TPR) repeat protein